MKKFLFQKIIHDNKSQIVILAVLVYLAMGVSFDWVVRVYAFDFRYPLSFSWQRAIVSHVVVMAVVLSLFVLRSSKFILAVLCCILVLLLFPTAIIFRNTPADWRIFLSHIVFFFSVYAISKIPMRIESRTIKSTHALPVLMVIGVLAIVPFLYIFIPHINLKNLWLEDIYESRKLQASLDNPYTSYTYSWLCKVIVPIGVVFGLMLKKYRASMISFAMLIFLFLCGAHKAVFLGAALILFFYIGSYEQKIKFFFSAVLTVLILSTMVYEINGQLYLSSLITRRVLILPAVLDAGYFDFFYDNHLYWSHSVLKWFIHYPYEVLPQVVMGKRIFNSPEVFANNGLISDGFMNAGMAGVGLNIIVVSIFFSFVNHLNLSHHFFGIVFLFLFSFVSSFVPVVFLTHGGIVFILIGQFFLKDTSLFDREISLT